MFGGGLTTSKEGKRKIDGKLYSYGGTFTTKAEARKAVATYKRIKKTREKAGFYLKSGLRKYARIRTTVVNGKKKYVVWTRTAKTPR